MATDENLVGTDTISIKSKKTYKQVWPAYNLAQTIEKHRFQVLLHALCKNLQNQGPRLDGPEPHWRTWCSPPSSRCTRPSAPGDSPAT